MKKKYFFLFFSLLAIYFAIDFTIGSNKFKNLKSVLNDEQKQLIKKYIFPYKFIKEQQQLISTQKRWLFEHQQHYRIKIAVKEKILSQVTIQAEQDKILSGSDLPTHESSVKLSNNKILRKYKLAGFYAGIKYKYPGSGFIDFDQDNIIILSSHGVLAFRKKIDDKQNFKQIRHNINSFIGPDQFKKSWEHNWFSLKDLFIYNNKIFISYTEEIKEDCWNTSIISGDLNYEKIEFKKFFSPKECVHSVNNIDGEFNAHQVGGKMILYDKNHILLAIGDYRNRYLVQDKDSVIGKIIKINLYTNDFKIISMGHRNPTGLYFDRNNNFILETEHGPQGGDEINLIEVNKISKEKILNYGWPISSAGEHYGGKDVERNKKKYKKYPLYKSHTKYGFIEPIKTFVPSIGISKIVKISDNEYIVSSMRSTSIYFMRLSEENKIDNFERVKVFERVRDLRFDGKKLYLFLENTASIGIINIF